MSNSTNNNSERWLENYYRWRDNIKNPPHLDRLTRFFDKHKVKNLRWCSKFFSDDPKLDSDAVNEFQMNYEKMKSGNIRSRDKCSY